MRSALPGTMKINGFSNTTPSCPTKARPGLWSLERFGAKKKLGENVGRDRICFFLFLQPLRKTPYTGVLCIYR